MGGASLSRSKLIYRDLMFAINVNLPIVRGNLLCKTDAFSEMKWNLSRKKKENIFINNVRVYFDETIYDLSNIPLISSSGENNFLIWLRNLLNPEAPSQADFDIFFNLAPIITLVENVILE